LSLANLYSRTGSIDGLSPGTTGGAPDGEPHSTPNPERACGPTPDGSGTYLVGAGAGAAGAAAAGAGAA
jgi:hypothetical protein